MSDTLDSAIASATEAAVSDLSGSTPPASEPTASPASDTAGETSAPTAPSGKDAAAPAPSSTDTATRRPSGKAATTRTAPPSAPTETSFTLEKHEQILKNARAKERDAVAAELKSYGLDLSDRNALENIRQFAANPKQYLSQWARHYNIPAEDIYGALTKPSPAATPANVRPEPDLVAEDGTTAYSAKGVEALMKWQMSQVDASLAARLAPFEQEKQRVEQARIVAQVNQEAKAEIDDAAQNWEGFTELKPRILELMQADGRRTMASAYAVALKEYLPKRKQADREAFLQEIKRAPVAPSDVTPRMQTRAGGKAKANDLASAVRNAVESSVAKLSGR